MTSTCFSSTGSGSRSCKCSSMEGVLMLSISSNSINNSTSCSLTLGASIGLDGILVLWIEGTEFATPIVFFVVVPGARTEGTA
ncbi:Os02g0462000 [Oryza sativa Japonica Group]|uniref:Os02g0462000 protein n=1 Tax=Oryza sativa subsp. japonica TaxID=39947 RepID=A0A0P0VIU5_ORYSJ|nr:hypothetical protein EE612_011179 [Oryza sativa]KAB8087199.1 hypothetical protein EE612_011179 [Oryza sativa]BAS78562.1 Os02g0462000 [Oryza sativa Japonica Group]